MSSVDNRVVNMQFNNEQFEKGISQSLNSLDKLKQSLNFSESTKNLKDLETTASKFDLSALGENVQAIANRFSTLGIVGMTAIQNITNSAMHLGKKLVTSIVNPLKQGGFQRAANLESAEFQITGLGKKWADVEEDISYAVQDTAYGLDAAAKAASQFLASDVKIGDEMKAALRGISGVAAMTNRSYDEIAQIFTSAAGAGRVMGGELTRISERGINAAATLAKYYREVKHEAGTTEADIREFARDSKIDFKTFAAAMDWAFGKHAKEANKTFDGALANMKAALSRIGAEIYTPYRKVARSIFNAFTPVINTVKETLALTGGFFDIAEEQMRHVGKKIRKGLYSIGYRTTKDGSRIYGHFYNKLTNIISLLTHSVENVGKFIDNVFHTIKAAFLDIFPKGTLKNAMRSLNRIAFSIFKLSFKLNITKETGDKLFRTFRGIFALLSIARSVLKTVIDLFGSLWKNSKGLRDGILSLAAGLGDFLTNLSLILKSSTRFASFVQKTKSIFGEAADGIGKFTNKVTEAFKRINGNDGDKANKKLGAMAALGKLIGSIFSALGSILESVIPAIANFVATGIKNIKDFLNTLVNALQSHDLEKASNVFKNIIAGGLLITAKWFIEQVSGLIRKAEPMVDTIKSVLISIRGAMIKMGKEKQYKMLVHIAKAVGILTASILILSGLDKKQLTKAIGAITSLIGQLIASVKILGGVLTGTKTFLGLFLLGNVVLKVSAAVFILSSALASLCDLSWNQLKRGLTALSSVIALTTIIAKIFITANPERMTSGMLGLIFMAKAIQMLSDAVIVLAKLKWDQLERGITALGGLMVLVTAFTHVSKASVGMIPLGIGLIFLAKSMKIFAAVAQDFADVEWEGLGKAATAISYLLGVITIFSRIASGRKMITTSVGMIIMGGALKIFASAFKDFGSLKWDQVSIAENAISTLLGTIALFTWLARGGKLIVLSVGMIALGSAFMIFTKAFKTFGKMNANQLASSVWAMTKIFDTIKDFSWWARGGKKILRLGAAMIMFGVAFNGFAAAAKIFASISWEGLSKGAVALGGLISIFTAFSLLASGGKMVLLAGGLLAMSVALGAMAAVLKGMSAIKWEDLGKGAVALAGMFTILGVATLVLKPLIPAMIGLSVAVAIFGAAIAAIGIGVLTLSTGITALGGAVGIIGKLLGTFIEALVVGLPKMLAAFAKAIGEFLKALADEAPKLRRAIKEINVTIIRSFTDSIPEFARTFRVIMDSLLPLLKEYIPKIVKIVLDLAIKVIDILIQKVPALMVKLSQLIQTIFKEFTKSFGEIKPETFIAAVTAFGVLIGLFVAMAKASSLMKDAIKTAIAMLVIFGAMTAMFLVLSTINAADILTMATGMSEALIAMSVCMGIVSKIGVDAAAAAKGAAALSVFITIMTAVMTAITWLLGQINQWSEDGEFLKTLNEGAEVLKAVGNAIGGFIGGIAGRFMEGLSSGLIGMADNLSEFMIRLTPFIAGAKMIDQSLVEGVGALASVILILTAAELLDGIASWLTGGTNFSKFGDEIVALAPAIAAYSQKVAGKIAVKDVKASAIALLYLAKMSNNLPRSGGLFQKIVGKNMSMSKFGKQMKSFGKAIVDYSEEVSGKKINYSAVKLSAKAGMAMSNLANKLPEFNGVAQWLGGTHQTLSEFGKELASFAPFIVDYSKAVSAKGAIDSKAVKASANAGKAMSNLANKLPEYNGAAQWFGGNRIKLSEFGYDLAVFGIYFGKYAEKIKDIDPKVINASTKAAQALATISNSLSESGGIAQIFGGKKDIGTFGKQLVNFGVYFKSYNDTIKDVKVSENTSDIISKLILFVRLLDAIGKSEFTDDKGNTFKNGINTIAESNIEGFVNAFKSFYKDGENAETLQKVGKNIMLSIANGALIGSETLSGKANKIVNGIVTSLTTEISDKAKHTEFATALKWYSNKTNKFSSDASTLFNNIGSTLIGKWIKGMNSQRASFGLALDKYTEKIDKKGEKWVELLTNTGINVITGLTEGINKYRDDPINALASIASAMIKKFKKKLKVHSPSRETFGIGYNTIMGLVKSFVKYKSLAVNSAGSIADSVLETLSTSLTNIADYLGSDFDDAPTIRPVLDLTDVQNGSKTISDLLADPAYGLNGMQLNGAAISGNIGLTDDSKLYNDANVLTAIGQLKSEVATLSETIQNLKIVMDTGATVGALASGIDNALGRVASYKERGI